MKKILLTLLVVSGFSALNAQIVITEVMYNPPESGTDTLEYIELYNNSGSNINMTDYVFTQGVTYTFPNYTLNAGEFVVICKDSSALINTMGLVGVNTLQWTTGALTNTGEDITLQDNLGTTLDSIDYESVVAPWPTYISGHSIVLCDYLSDNNDGANWLIADSSNTSGVVVNGNEIFSTIGSLGGCSSPGLANTPCGDLYFSEYIEGSSSNKALEIYNPRSVDVDLTEYVIYRFNNGSLTPTDSLFPQGVLVSEDVFVVANPSANPAIMAQGDTTHTLTFYNGDDALALINRTTGDTLDVIGEIGVDPGSGWIVGTGATNNFTLIRMMNIQNGTSNWTIGATQWDVFPIDMTDSLGAHTQTACAPIVNPFVSFTIASQTEAEGIGTVTVDVDITNENSNPTSVDIVLNVASSATNGLDFSFTFPTTVTFPANSNATQSIVISITDDVILEPLEDIILDLSNPTNNASISSGSHTINIQDNEVAPDFGSCSDLFFSEYIEGSSNNKALEIYNPTCDSIDLGDYQIQRFTNGSPTASGTYVFPAGTMIASQDVYVIGNGSADTLITSVSDTTNAATFFNGDDAITLTNLSTGDTLDIIGVVGVDPGTNWTVGTGATSEFTLVRMSNVHDGTTDWMISSTQWEVLPMNTFDSLGAHYATSCAGLALVASFNVDTTICLGSSAQFNNFSTSGSCSNTYSWDFGDGSPLSNVQNPNHTYASIGSFSVTLTIDDGVSTDDTTIVVTVQALDDASIVASGPYCENTGMQTLSAVTAGGTWSGPAISDAINGIFDPSIAVVGNNTVYYTTAGNCPNTDSIIIVVEAQDNAAFSYSDTTYCVGDVIDLNNFESPIITGDAGTFSGSAGLIIDGITGNIYSDSTVIEGGGIGTYTVTMITNGQCPDTATFDVTFTFCPGVNEQDTFTITVYPNPSESVLYINGISDQAKYEILDISGRIISNGFCRDHINIIDLPVGTYILRLIEDQKTALKSFVKK